MHMPLRQVLASSHPRKASFPFPQMMRSRPGPAGECGLSSEEPLSVACRWFDYGCAGYMRDEDLEEIAFMVCDDISRKAPNSNNSLVRASAA